MSVLPILGRPIPLPDHSNLARVSVVPDLHSIAKRFLPSSFLHTWRDLKSTDLPPPQKGNGHTPRLNILKSHYFPRRTIYFVPERPLPGSVSYEGSEAHRGAVAYKLCRLLGYGITTNAPYRYEMVAPDRYDVVFKYERATYLSSLSRDEYEARPVINGDCTDVSKRAVNDAFEETFGYSLGVNPTTYAGRMVVKSNINAAHDGRLVQGPLAPAEVQPDCAYQKVIDNTVSGEGAVLDYRLPIYGKKFPLVYRKYRPIESRFDSRSVHTTLADPTEVFSSEELDKIHRMAVRMGVDFGEVDVLRDNENGRIYVVDVNPTPWGPPRGMTASSREEALLHLKTSFEQLIDSRLSRKERIDR